MRNGMFTADGHAHVFEEPTVLGGRRVHHPASRLVQEMDRHGVDLSLVIARPATADVSVPELHDGLAEACAPYAQRLGLAAWAAPRTGPAGVLEVRRALGLPLFCALKLHPEQERFNIDDDDVDPLVRVAADHDVPVVVHTALAVRGAEPWRLLRLARRYRTVTFVMAHLGSDGGLLQSSGAVDIAAGAPNIVVDGSETVTDPYATYLGPAERLGPERVLLGSGEPVHQIALALLKLDLLEMPDEWRRAIAGLNLARLLGRQPATSRP
jgi:predicted TIM-barrel fold metal-dependent hydrolase